MNDTQQPIANATSPDPGGQEEAQVEVHKPKAVHGWRELLNEIAVIVVGVLIALGAEQTVESLHWRHQIEAGEDALRDNARELVDAAAEREAESPCMARRFDSIAAVLDAASASDRLPAVGQLGSPSWRTWVLPAWDGLVASQVTMHMPRDQMLEYAHLAVAAQRLERLNAEERSAWTDLYTIVGPGRAFGDAEQAATRTALSQAVRLAKDQRYAATALSGDVREASLLDAAQIRAIRTTAAAQYRVDARDGIMCKPLSDAPRADHYGQAPSPVDLSAPFRP